MPSVRKLALGAFFAFGGGMLTVSGPDMMVTTREAAGLCRVKIDTVRKWVRRGHLEVAGLNEVGWPMYRVVDVAKAEYKTRERARRP